MENQTLNRERRRLIERFLKKPVSETMSQDEIIKHLEKALQSLEPNLIMMGDAYKYSHHKFYTEGLTTMISYLESRGGKFQETVMFGLQYIIKKYLTGSVLSAYMADEAEEKLNGENGVFGKGGSFSLKRNG